jgi:hypothetical protein
MDDRISTVKRLVLHILLLMLLAICLPGILPGQDELSSGQSISITRESIKSALGELTQGDQYRYPESSLYDPPWVQVMNSWIRMIRERWSVRSGFEGSREASTAVALSIAALGVVLFLVWLITMIAMRRMEKASGASGTAGEAEAGTGTWGEFGLNAAIDAARAGNLREAVSRLFRSLLRGLDGSGWINYQKGKASRVYLRQLRRSDELYPLFRDFLWRFELAYYRERTPGEDDWRFLYDTFNRMARAANEHPGPSMSRKS